MRTTNLGPRACRMTAALAAAALVTSGCAAGGGAEAEAGTGTGTIDVWAAQGAEAAAIEAAVDAFNSSQDKITAKLKLIAGGTYTSTIQNTPVDELPDVIEMDGPTVASFAYDMRITPISEYVSPETVDNATEGAIAEGTANGELYALAQFDSAMGLFGNKAMLDEAGVEYPKSVADAWTAEEFGEVLRKLADKSPTGKSLNVDEANLGSEWGTYGFSPLIWSAGGNLIEDGKAAGVLDSDASVEALTEFASWKPYVDSNADGNALPKGRVALGWGGHWLYPTYSEALGDDLVALPLPDMGEGAKAGSGSRVWGISASTDNAKAAGAFLDSLLSDESVKAVTEANGAPPATKTAFADAELYQPGGALELWGEQLAAACASSDITPDCVAVSRPVTPGYPAITTAFGSALAAIWGGTDPKAALTEAATKIDQTFADNNGYE